MNKHPETCKQHEVKPGHTGYDHKLIRLFSPPPGISGSGKGKGDAPGIAFFSEPCFG